MNDNVRMSDIADRLGVSTVTVSKALAGKEGVSGDLKKEIIEIALEMGYKKQRNKQVGINTNQPVCIIIAKRLKEPDHSFYWALCLNAIKVLKEFDFLSILEILKEEQEDSNKIPDCVNKNQVSAIMVLGKLKKKYLEYLVATNLPMVILDNYTENINVPSVIPDNFYGGYNVTKYLINKGHRKIGFVGNINENSNSQDRYYGFLKALQLGGLQIDNDWVIQDRNIHGFKDEFDLPKKMPTAFFCNCDQSAFHFVKYLQKSGYTIPNDVSIIGFYDYVFSRLLEPKFSTYHIDLNEMAIEAVQIIINIRRKYLCKDKTIIQGRIVERDSVLSI